MFDATLWNEIVLAVIIGGLTGRLVDFGAVQLLFRPYSERRIFGLKLHGVLPARQDALARQLANSIADRLLSPETLATFLSSPEMAQRITENVQVEVDRLFERDLPSVREFLGELLPNPQALDDEIKVVAGSIAEYVGTLASNPGIRERTAHFVVLFLVERKASRMDQLVPPGILDAVEHFARNAVEGLIGQPEMLATGLETWLTNLVAPGDLLSASAQDALRSQAREHAPDWLKAIEESLRRPETRAWLDRYVLDSIERFVEDLPSQGFLNELVGWFIRTTYRENKAFYRQKLLEILPGQVASFRESLKDPAVLERFNRKLIQALDEFLATPLGERYASIPESLRTDLRGFVVQLLSSEATRSSLFQVIERMLDRFRAATLEEFLPPEIRKLDPEHLEAAALGGPIRDMVDFGCDLLLEAGLQARVQVLLQHGTSFLLSRPIGRLKDRVGPERLARIHGTIETQLLAIAQREAPRLARMIDVRALVEARVRGASAPAIESMVKSLARKELNSIFTKGLYGGVAVSLVLNAFLLGSERLADWLRPGSGLPVIAAMGLAMLVIAVRYLRIPEPPSAS